MGTLIGEISDSPFTVLKNYYNIYWFIESGCRELYPYGHPIYVIGYDVLLNVPGTLGGALHVFDTLDKIERNGDTPDTTNTGTQGTSSSSGGYEAGAEIIWLTVLGALTFISKK